MKLLEYTESQLATEFLGIVEYAKHYVIGWIGDPYADTNLSSILLQYPIEFVHKPLAEGMKLEVGCMVPKFGLEEARIVEASDLRVISAASGFGKVYLEAVRKYWNLKITYTAIPIGRPPGIADV